MKSKNNSNSWQPWLDASVSNLKQRALFRSLRPTIPGDSPVQVQVTESDLQAWLSDSKPSYSLNKPSQTLITVKLFSLNDYLGLSTHPDVCAAASQAALAYGNGPRSSALVGGYTCYHRDLETALARLKGTEDALLFPTGFAANLAIVSALASAGDVDIFSDELNHASIIDGARLGKRGDGSTQLHIYRHNDMAHLDSLLRGTLTTASRTSNKRRKQLVVTDSLFSMDGDFADLQGLAALKKKHGFLLAVDEAHATLVCGPNGEGAVASAGVEDSVDLHIGTLSKAFGAMGGFVACSIQWKDLFVNLGRAQVFSTSLPVPVVVSALAALKVAAKEPWRRHHVHALAQRVGAGLGVQAQSPIVPVVIGGEAETMGACTELLRRGFHVPGIRPPTVPAGTSRLRVSLSAGHSTSDVDELLAAVKEVCFGTLTGGNGRGIVRSFDDEDVRGKDHVYLAKL
ncbi:hypothetical protein Ndes2526B_g03440 [Nannochloris sp. 'desiccata']|nr:hypothetical protein KSW81_006361 [Chlorella desiccata (nom. nud.)]